MVALINFLKAGGLISSSPHLKYCLKKSGPNLFIKEAVLSSLRFEDNGVSMAESKQICEEQGQCEKLLLLLFLQSLSVASSILTPAHCQR